MNMLIVVLTMLCFPPASYAAEITKLTHVASVYTDQSGGGIKQPEGIACAAQSRFIVSDTGNGRLLSFILQDQAVQPVTEIKVPGMTYPLNVRANSRQELYVLDGKQHRIFVINADGTLKGYLDPAGAPPPALISPRSLAVGPDDQLFLLDIFGERVLVLGPQGVYIRQIAFPAGYGFISDIAVDGKGTIFLIDSVRSLVLANAKDVNAFTPFTESLKEYVDFPEAITVSGRGKLLITDRNGGSLVVIGPDGSFLERLLRMGRTEGLLNYPAQTCINDRGELFIADRSNSRLQIFVASP